MNSQQPISHQAIIPLFVATYQGSSTAQINDTYNILLETAKQNPVHFIKMSQKILETQTHNHYLCQSVSNFIKFIVKFIIDNKLISGTGPKDFINKIENLFDNDKISFQYKQNIALSFIKAAFHFQTNLQKIVGRISFLYNTKEIQKAVLLARAYLASESRLDAKTQNFYYNKVLKLEINNLSQQILSLRKLISEGKGQNQEMTQKRLKNILELLKNLHSALVFIRFEKFESSIFKCLEGREIINVVNSLQIFRQNDDIVILLRELIQKIAESICRMRRTHKLPDLMQAISENLHVQWKLLQQNLQNRNSLIFKGVNSVEGSELQKQLSQIRLVNAGLNSRVILILDDGFDILNVLVHPLFQIRSQIFQKNQNDVKETVFLYEDTCFSMKSQCLEVQFNRFVKALLVNYEIISSKLYLSLDEIMFNNKNFKDYLANNQNTFILLWSLLAFQTSYFMTNTALMTKLDVFIKKFEHVLFNNQNIELYFHSLLIIFNYLDDLFPEELQTQIFQTITQNFIHNRIQINQGNSANVLIAQFEKKILKNFYQRRYEDKDVSKQYFMLIQYLSTTFDPEAASIYLEVIRNYSIEDKITLDIFDKMLESISEIVSNNLMGSEGSHDRIRIFTKFLEVFFDSDIYKHLFESTLSRILPVFQKLISCEDLFMDEFFNIMKNAVKHLEYVPQNYYCWMSNLFVPQRLQNQEAFYSLISVLKYAKPSNEVKTLKYEIFVNFTALTLIQTIFESLHGNPHIEKPIETANLFAQTINSKQFFAKPSKSEFSKRQFLCLITLHQLIYYHSGYLTRKTLEKIVSFSATQMQIPEQNLENEQPIHTTNPQFSFVQGKYQLLFVILFRRRVADVNQILCKFNIEKSIYNAVYMRDFHYLMEYDTPILIKEQSQILKNLIVGDKLQMACANTSFLVIFYKFSVLYQMKIKEKRNLSEYIDMDSSDSDEEEFENITEFNTNFKYAVKLVKNLPLPQEWSQVNELKEIKEFIQILRSSQPAREWLNLLMSNCMNKDQVQLMKFLMKDLEIVNGTYRHIKKVNKNLLNSPNRQHII